MTTPKTFYPQTPVEFSASLISNLDSSLESDYTRQQFSEQYLEKELNKKLKKLEEVKVGALDSKLKSLLLPDTTDDGKSVSSINAKLNSVTESLKKLNASSPVKSQALLDAEKKVTSCLKSSKGKVLNCWEEVEAFKKLADEL
ncbi:hypothetical protein CANARDRAFT_26080 [[Candida] arabinofermentans NRRL YB-2248]|uniref:Altered inheritance of mitochondria protein 13, mitochondrial n=1 Tax=[Candida] arabinofermentans NRRL YB-2248 TaxID=983967 RepID=A0A1E4T814_9ASCO|nr:hypothetical protein CANARDRAFT_26080 [[Candida] arabinofermentans NRRL YB-2248]